MGGGVVLPPFFPVGGFSWLLWLSLALVVSLGGSSPSCVALPCLWWRRVAVLWWGVRRVLTPSFAVLCRLRVCFGFLVVAVTCSLRGPSAWLVTLFLVALVVLWWCSRRVLARLVFVLAFRPVVGRVVGPVALVRGALRGLVSARACLSLSFLVVGRPLLCLGRGVSGFRCAALPLGGGRGGCWREVLAGSSGPRFFLRSCPSQRIFIEEKI